MEIFLIQDGQQTGPFTADSVQAMLTEGRVRPQDIGWRKGLAGWVPLSEVLESGNGTGAETPEQAASEEANGANGSSAQEPAATAKQKALLKYLGAEFPGDISRRKAALAICDAMENPKLQKKFRKWQEEKWRLHPDVFQDEIDFRRANRVTTYLELSQTEGAEVVSDVTKAHVQVIVESLDKKYPQWEAESHAALWDYLLPAIVEHFPKLMRADWKGRLRLGGTSKIAAVAAAQAGAPVGAPMPRAVPSVLAPPPAPPGALAAAGRGLVYGVIALGLIIGGNYGYKRWQAGEAKPAAQNSPPAPAPAKSEAPSSEAAAPTTPAVEKPAAAAVPPAEIPPPPAPDPAPATPPPTEAKATAPAPELAAPMAESKPPLPEEKPTPVATNPPPESKPAMTEEKPPTPPPAPATPAEPRTMVNLTQGIGVALPNGNVTLPAGTQLRFIALDGPNVRVSWNNNVFDVPAAATDVGNATATPATPEAPAAPDGPMKKPGAKPSDDL